MYQNFDKLKIGGAMVVGGSFDYYVGKTILPPEWIASIGLEWLWRLSNNPAHIRRVFTAVIIFPLLLVKEKLLNR